MFGVQTRRLLQGLVFMLVIALLLGLTVAKFQRRFERSVDISLRVPRAGSQLEKNADVKLRGIVVGRVAAQRITDGGAVLEVALQPDKVPLIPANVRVRILPKTLFGEKYIDLVLPESPEPPITEGTVIEEDRTEAALEVERVLADLFPLLRALEPEKLNRALTAIAAGLRGRGEKLGQSLANLDRYLAGIEPELPTIQKDLSGLADLASTLDSSADDLLRIARNAAFSGRTITEKGDVLAHFLRGTADFADTFKDVLERDGDRLIKLAEQTRITLEVVYPKRGILPETVRDLERLLIGLNSALDHGANGEECDQPTGPADPFICALDIRVEIVPNRGIYPTACQYPTCGQASPAAKPGAPTIGPVGSKAERELLQDLLSPLLRVPRDQVPDVVGLLFGPVLRGTEVAFQ